MGTRTMVRLGAAFPLRVLLGLSLLRAWQASKNFNTEKAENHGDPRRKVRMALRAKRFTSVLQQDGVAVCPSFLRGSPWFSASSVKKTFLLVSQASSEQRT
jgi:hypothetical protein